MTYCNQCGGQLPHSEQGLQNFADLVQNFAQGKNLVSIDTRFPGSGKFSTTEHSPKFWGM